MRSIYVEFCWINVEIIWIYVEILWIYVETIGIHIWNHNFTWKHSSLMSVNKLFNGMLVSNSKYLIYVETIWIYVENLWIYVEKYRIYVENRVFMWKIRSSKPKSMWHTRPIDFLSLSDACESV